MARVVAVHGSNYEYSGASTVHAAWFPALRDGVGHAGGGIEATDVAVAFYGDVFRPAERLLGVASSDPDVDDIDDYERALLLLWWAEAARRDASVVPPDARTLGRGGRTVQAVLAALSCSRLFAGIAEEVLIHWVRQTRRYLTDPAIRAQVRDRVVAAVGSDTRVVVGHSLGSVVAYEALCAHPCWPVRSLVTLGSPLGVRHLVFDRLRPPPTAQAGEMQGVWPAGLRSWTNIADEDDVVALVKDLRSRFGPRVRCVEVSTGARAHDVTRYLTASATGHAIWAGMVGD